MKLLLKACRLVSSNSSSVRRRTRLRTRSRTFSAVRCVTSWLNEEALRWDSSVEVELPALTLEENDAAGP